MKAKLKTAYKVCRVIQGGHMISMYAGGDAQLTYQMRRVIKPKQLKPFPCEQFLFVFGKKNHAVNFAKGRCYATVVLKVKARDLSGQVQSMSGRTINPLKKFSGYPVGTMFCSSLTPTSVVLRHRATPKF